MNEIVSLEIAKLLKEVGFDIETSKFYFNKYRTISENSTEALMSNNSINWNAESVNDFYYSAPTIASVVDWIFETYGDWISVRREYADGADGELFGYESCIELEDGVNYSDTFKTPTEAYRAGIKTYLLTYLEPNI